LQGGRRVGSGGEGGRRRGSRALRGVPRSGGDDHGACVRREHVALLRRQPACFLRRGGTQPGFVYFHIHPRIAHIGRANSPKPTSPKTTIRSRLSVRVLLELILVHFILQCGCDGSGRDRSLMFSVDCTPCPPTPSPPSLLFDASPCTQKSSKKEYISLSLSVASLTYLREKWEHG
jgi:hypothetical protein